MKEKSILFVLMLVMLTSFATAQVDINEIAGVDFVNDTDVTFTEGLAHSIQVEASSNATGDLVYELSDNAPQGMDIDDEGLISWLVPPGQAAVEDIHVTVTEDIAQGVSLTKTFNARIKPVLEISSVKLARQGENLQAIENEERFDGFLKPGQNGTLVVEIKNNFIAGGQNVITREDVDETIEAVQLSIMNGGVLGNNPYVVNRDERRENLFVRAQHTLPIRINFQVPLNQVEGDVDFRFNVQGSDRDVPSHQYRSQYDITIPIRQSSHEVQISDVQIDDEISCAQKQQDIDLTVHLTNVGLEDMEDVTIQVFDENTQLARQDVMMNANEMEVDFSLDLHNITGEQELRVVSRRTNEFDLVYDSESVSVTIENCAPEFTNLANQQLQIQEDMVARYNISDLVENVEETQSLQTRISNVNENLTVVVQDEQLVITPRANYFTSPGEQLPTFNMTVNDGVDEISNILRVSVQQEFDDDVRITDAQPSTAQTINLNSNIEDVSSEDFNITIENIDGRDVAIAWFVKAQDANEVNQNDNDEFFTFDATNLDNGDYVVKVTLTYQDANGQDQTLKREWDVVVTDVPLGFDRFPGERTTSDFDNIHNVELVLENNNGIIEWDDNVDISQIRDISTVVKIENGQVLVDSQNAASLNQAAIVTLKRGFTRPIILRSQEFANPQFDEVCPQNVCRIIQNANGQIKFSVTGFSGFQVQEERAAALEVASEVTQENVARGEETTINVTVKNVGTNEALTNVNVQLDVTAQYNAREVSDLPAQIAANAEHVYEFAVTVPEDEDGGKQRIGTMQITSDQSNKTVTLYVKPQSFLEITDIDIEGGDLRIDEEFDIDVDIKNNLDIDIEDVEVECIIKDIDDGDDEEENSDEDDIRAGRDETFTCTFDLSNADIEDDDTFTIEVTAEGKDENGVRHSVTETTTAGLDLERDDVVIEDVSLSPSSLTCNANTNLEIRYKNMGSRDQDDMVLRVRNSQLGIDMQRDDLELDKFTDRNNDDEESFNINVPNAEPGTYTLEVSLYLDKDDLEDTRTVDLAVNECGTTRSQTQAQDSFTTQDYARQLQAKLNSQLQAQAFQPAQATQGTSKVHSSFRDSQTYIILLGALVFLGLIALILAVVVLASKPAKKKR